ncbi:MAG: DUF2726 domain-containing protein [Pseudomonadota bacterium]|nr:DUF2726 domain-containing protein [Pseudomonadota bacterium]
MTTFSSIAAALAVLMLVAVAALGGIVLARRRRRVAPLPTHWSLSARPVFSTDERRVYKLMREALPHHVILSKLPLVRFCQPNDPGEVRYWYELLGSINVTFAVCSANGRVLAAIDLDMDRGNSRRILQIKQSVLGACRVRYLRCPVDNLPSAAELQLLVPSATAASRGSPSMAAPSTDLDEARDSLASTVASRRAQRNALWHDSSVFQDSFFAPDSRSDNFGGSDFSGLQSAGPVGVAGTSRADFATSGNGGRNGSDRESRTPRDRDADDGGAVVVDSLTPPPVHSRH